MHGHPGPILRVRATHRASRVAVSVDALLKTLCAGFALLAATFAMAQGGPPLVTDDPGTPGDGKWEINLAAIAAHLPGRREVAFPDADINYGWGDHVQLKVDIPWVFVSDASSGRNGLGEGNFGVKWRFVDREQFGVAFSTYPQYGRYLLMSSVRRDVASDEKSLFLPIEAAAEVGGFGLDAEIGRNFVKHGTNQWQAGVIVAHACSETVECLAEVHETFSPHIHQTLLNLGLGSKVNESLSLLGAVGRDFGGPREDRRSILIHLGVQILH